MMMIVSTRLRRLVAACCTFAFLMAAAPAYSASTAMMAGNDTVSPTVDVLLLRPVAFVSLIGGIAIFAATLPFVAITRPHEIGKPFGGLVGAPARYLWLDPLGSH